MSSSRSPSFAPGTRTPTSGLLVEALFAASVLVTAACGALAVALGGRSRPPSPPRHDTTEERGSDGD